MTAPAADLQKAVVAALAADAELLALLGGPKIFDHAPPNAMFPYVTFGRTSVYDWSTGTEAGAEQILSLHVWSKERGRRETLDILERCRQLLDDVSLTLDDNHLVNMRLAFSEVSREDDLAIYRGMLRFRGVTESV
ncbi:MAG: DUF3168 domain-containing protein [Rhizobiaceae bacterium]